MPVVCTKSIYQATQQTVFRSNLVLQSLSIISMYHGVVWVPVWEGSLGPTKILIIASRGLRQQIQALIFLVRPSVASMILTLLLLHTSTRPGQIARGRKARGEEYEGLLRKIMGAEMAEPKGVVMCESAVNGLG